MSLCTDQSVSAIRAVGVPVCVCLRNSHVTVRFVRLAQKFVMQNDWEFLDVVLLYKWTVLEYIVFCSGISAVTKMKIIIIIIIIMKLKTTSVEVNPSVETGLFSASQEFKGILWKTNVYCPVQYMPPLFSTFG